jgi:hypothetical protein
LSPEAEVGRAIVFKGDWPVLVVLNSKRLAGAALELRAVEPSPTWTTIRSPSVIGPANAVEDTTSSNEFKVRRRFIAYATRNRSQA